MSEHKQQRRIEEVAPGLVRIVDGDTYVYLSSGSAHLLADKRTLAQANSVWAESTSRSRIQQGAQHA